MRAAFLMVLFLAQVGTQAQDPDESIGAIQAKGDSEASGESWGSPERADTTGRWNESK